MDIVTTFLYISLNEVIYIEQLQLFVMKEDKICKQIKNL